MVSIDSQPQGADVYIDRKLVGQTPCMHEFLYYGGHHIELTKKDHNNLRTTLKLKAPIYEYFPISIFSELLIPWEIVDMHVASYKLEKGQRQKPIITPVEKPQPDLPSAELDYIEHPE